MTDQYLDRPAITHAVFDTSALVNMFVEDQPEFANGQRLAEWLIANNVPVTAPRHALFELMSALTRLQLARGKEQLSYNLAISEERPLRVRFVDINEEFFIRYFDRSIPYMKAADLVFVSMAKKDNAALVTEDRAQREKARGAGVPALTIREFLQRIDAGEVVVRRPGQDGGEG